MIMEQIPDWIGITGEELGTLITMAIVLLVGLFLARLAFRLTRSLMRVGCTAVLLLVIAIFLVQRFMGG
jgi:hypothetical protein